jgi:hypothetical protein
VGFWQRSGFGTPVTSDATSDAADSDVTVDAAPAVVTPFTQAQCASNAGTWCASLNACLPNTGCNYFCQGTYNGQSGVQCFTQRPAFSLVCDPASVVAACPQ